MKKIVVLITILAISVSISFAQKEKKHSHKNKTTVAVSDTTKSYHCSMKCLDDKHYAKEGKCEKCGMKLVKDAKK
jgi:uncharacterized paraquat-inducible protein A